MADFDRESMLEMFTFEMSQLLEQLETTIIEAESGYSMDQINEIFRIMHTIKGSAAMMKFDSMSTTAHSIEDLFYYLREENPKNLDYSRLTDLVLAGMDFVKEELSKIQNGDPSDGDGSSIVQEMKRYLSEIKGGGTAPAAKAAAPGTAVPAIGKAVSGKGFTAKIYFVDGCEMENIRAYTLVHNISDIVQNISHTPEDVIDEEAAEVIRREGFTLFFDTDKSYDEIFDVLSQTVYLKDLILEQNQTTDQQQLEKTADAGPKRSYEALVRFEEGSEMENVRAYALVHSLEGRIGQVTHDPLDLVDEAATGQIRNMGLKLFFETEKGYDEVYEILSSTIYLKDLTLTEVNGGEAETIGKEDEIVMANTQQPSIGMREPQREYVESNTGAANAPPTAQVEPENTPAKKSATQHVINVSVSKLDQLLNLMGELVIAEAMVTQNPDLEGLEMESFTRETVQLRKIIKDVQDTVMSMRMVPLSTTFFKMHRLVRDMCRSLSKDVELKVVGDETEVDKNIIEHISDPLMHIIRNSIDHGIETPDERKAAGKSSKGSVILEAKNTGGDVLIIVRDDGRGLNKDAIMRKAKNNGLLRKPENEYTEKEIHQFVFLPGFSTNDSVTQFSGRGVGMDVVSTNLEVIGGSVLVDSLPGEGSTFTMKIPLTLAIIEGMNIKMGDAMYTIPIASIRQSFKAKKESVFVDPSGNEMITDRDEVFNVVRLYEFFNVASDITDVEDGIMIMLENGDQTICLFADDLIGEQQVVVKNIPAYIKKIKGISGCTLLGNGDISLIIDAAGFFDR